MSGGSFDLATTRRWAQGREPGQLGGVFSVKADEAAARVEKRTRGREAE